MSPDSAAVPPPEPKPRRRKRRYFVVGGLLLVIVGFLVIVKFAQIATLIGFGKKMAAQGPPPEAVSTDIAEQDAWETTFNAVGSLAGVQSVVVSTEVPGIVSRINFDSGKTVRQGDTLVELDASQERAQLASAKAQRDNASVIAARTRKLVSGAALPRQTLDVDETALRTAQAQVDTIEAQMEKKKIRAPFDGKLGIRAVMFPQAIYGP